MSTTLAKKETVSRKWYILDAAGKPLGRTAATAADIVLETLAADVSERGATRMDDKTSEASMEKRKKDGYF